MELPDENSVVLTRRDQHAIVQRVEHAFHHGSDLTDKGLIEEGNVRLRIVVPNLDQVVLAAGEHKSAIFT